MSITPLSLPPPPRGRPEFGRDALIVCESLVRIYQTGSVEVQALQGLDLLVDSGEMVAVVGAVRVGQVDAAVHPRRHRRPHRRAGAGRPVGPAGDVPRRPGATTGGTPSGSSGSRRRATSCPT